MAIGLYPESVSSKGKRFTALAGGFRAAKPDPHYASYFDCFNRQEFYEAHEALEYLWLPDRRGPNAAFYKGLIQLAAAFVHLQKYRLQPATALFKLARSNLEKYPGRHERLDVAAVRGLIGQWLDKLERGQFGVNPLQPGTAPKLKLEGHNA